MAGVEGGTGGEKAGKGGTTSILLRPKGSLSVYWRKRERKVSQGAKRIKKRAKKTKKDLQGHFQEGRTPAHHAVRW